MQARHRTEEPAVESELVDLGGVSLIELRTLGGPRLRSSLRHAVERASHIRVTASGSGNNAQRVD
ncbi:hypothetical protein [Amycolatopsis sp. NPDC003731]